MPEIGATLEPSFENLEQQHETSTLGMWVFLATEIMFFGGILLGYTVYRFTYPTGFATGSAHLKVALGAANTAILLCSSLTMALAVRSAQLGHRRNLITLFLMITIVLGLCFLGIKGLEYYLDYQEGLVPGIRFTYLGADPGHILSRHVELFFVLYFIMTSIHGLHMVIGISVLSVLIWMVRKQDDAGALAGTIEISGLYWHFVDIIWIFLFPLLYLIG